VDGACGGRPAGKLDAPVADSERDQKNSSRSDGGEPQNVQEEIGQHHFGADHSQYPPGCRCRQSIAVLFVCSQKEPALTREGARVVAGQPKQDTAI
jgi:hypothetical protein